MVAPSTVACEEIWAQTVMTERQIRRSLGLSSFIVGEPVQVKILDAWIGGFTFFKERQNNFIPDLMNIVVKTPDGVEVDFLTHEVRSALPQQRRER